MRLLFCLFAEDIGLLPPKLFSVLLERTRRRPADFKAGSHSQCSSDCSSLDGEGRAGGYGQRFSDRGFFP